MSFFFQGIIHVVACKPKKGSEDIKKIKRGRGFEVKRSEEKRNRFLFHSSHLKKPKIEYFHFLESVSSQQKKTSSHAQENGQSTKTLSFLQWVNGAHMYYVSCDIFQVGTTWYKSLPLLFNHTSTGQTRSTITHSSQVHLVMIRWDLLPLCRAFSPKYLVDKNTAFFMLVYCV